MRKYIILLFISAFALGACDKNDDYTVREWTVASQLGISHGFHTLQPVLLVKANDDTSWRAVYEGIEGFDYEPGYEYKLRIKAKQLADPPQDASSVRYSLLELISKTPARSNIPDSYYPTFTMEVAPRTRQLLRRIVPQRPFPRSRPERLAAVAVPDRGIRLRTGLQLQAESRHLGRRSGRRILHGTVFGARNAGQTAGAGVNRQRYLRTGPSYEGPVFTFRTPGGFHPRHSSGVIHPTLSVRRHLPGAIHPTLSVRHSLQASFLQRRKRKNMPSNAHGNGEQRWPRHHHPESGAKTQ